MISSWKFVLVSVIVLIGLGRAMAQDVHFSHIHATPMALNPAMTGVFEGKARLIANYRNQWKSVTADYKTFMFSADANFSAKGGNSVIGLGTQVINDVAGDLNYTLNSTMFSASVLQAFDAEKSHMLSAGIQAGAVSNRFDPSAAVITDDEPLIFQDGGNRNSYFDLSLGLLWFMKLRQGNHLFFGASALHVNNPSVSFISTTGTEILYRRLVVHGGANLSINKQYTIIPNFIFMAQGPNREFTFGSFVRYNNPVRDSKGQAAVMLGAWLRGNRLNDSVKADAIIASLRLDYSTIILSLSYDINISSLSQISTGRGGPELSLIYSIANIGKRNKQNGKAGTKKKSGVKCPVF